MLYFPVSSAVDGKGREGRTGGLFFRRLRAFPSADGEVPGEVHVHEVLELVGDLEAEPLAHHHVPGGAEPLVQRLLDEFGRALVVGGVLLAGVHAYLQHLRIANDISHVIFTKRFFFQMFLLYLSPHVFGHVCLLDHGVGEQHPLGGLPVVALLGIEVAQLQHLA